MRCQECERKWITRYSIVGETVKLSDDILFCCRDQWIAQACNLRRLVKTDYVELGKVVRG